MKTLAMSAVLISITLLAGCSPQAEPSQSPTVDSQPGTSEEQAEPSLDASVLEIVIASYSKFETLGMTETATSDGEVFTLLYDPSLEDYQAVILDRTTGEATLVFETDYFTLFSIYLIAQHGEGAFTKEEEDVYLVEDENYGSIRFFVEDGLIVGAEGKDQSWNASFDYAVDEQMKQLLLLERQELLDSFTD
jgi:hypothetical protein